MTQKTFTKFSWSILLMSIVIPVYAWGSNLNWNIGSITLYQWFPLFGLLAWMVMWTHYINGAIRLSDTRLRSPRFYSKSTAWLVLTSLLLHPGLLAYEQWSNGVGLPPTSWYDYAGESLAIAVLFGSISLAIFLSFEIFNRLKEKPGIKKIWPAISISQSLAMIFIFVHALRLGTNLVSGWFLWVWIAYGLALIPCFYIIHKADFSK